MKSNMIMKHNMIMKSNGAVRILRKVAERFASAVTFGLLFFALLMAGCQDEPESGKVVVRVVETDNAQGSEPNEKSLTGKGDVKTKNNGDSAGTNKEDAVSTNSTTASIQRPVQWNTVFNKVIGPRCAVCHTKGSAAGAGLSLQTYEEFLGSAPTSYGLVFFVADESVRMPKGAPLTQEEKDILALYMADGTKP